MDKYPAYVRGATIHDWVYQYIAAFVSQYSDILYDTVKCELADFYR